MSTHVEATHPDSPGIPTFAKVWAALVAMTVKVISFMLCSAAGIGFFLALAAAPASVR